MPDPTRATYISFGDAFDWFNSRLFSGVLSLPLISLQRRRGSYGYFAGERFGTRDQSEVVDEIALNPVHFDRPDAQSLSTLVHEMAHLWQHHHGKPSRGGYHNRQWAAKMKEVGLQPDNGSGRETGQSVSHHIMPGGAFDRACTELLSQGVEIRYRDIWGQNQTAPKKTRSKYTCAECGLNMWGRPEARIRCEDCNQAMDEGGKSRFVLYCATQNLGDADRR
jgi:predicted SprT family Zn-dependent metalloprotease